MSSTRSPDTDVTLTLDEAAKAGDNGADTVSLTAYRSGVAVVYYDAAHTLTEAESTLKLNEENAVIKGTCAYAAISRAKSLMNQINDGGSAAPDKIQSWGISQLQIYRDMLGRLKRVETKKSY